MHPSSKDISPMSAVASDSDAQGWAKRLEESEAARSSAPLGFARQRLAGRLGIQPGTLENLRRGRIKGVRRWIYERLKAAMIVELQREIAAQTHELEMLIQSGAHPASGEIQEVQAGLAALRRTLMGGIGGSC